MNLNRQLDPIRGLSAEDAPEEFARRAMIDALAQTVWIFGVDPNSILVTSLRQVLNVEPTRPVRPPPVNLDDVKRLVDRLLDGIPATEWSRTLTDLHNVITAKQVSIGRRRARPYRGTGGAP